MFSWDIVCFWILYLIPFSTSREEKKANPYNPETPSPKEGLPHSRRMSEEGNPSLREGLSHPSKRWMDEKGWME